MTQTSEQIRAEIVGRFSFFPPFFQPALATPQVLDNLWRQTLSAYVDNPLSALFKEKLNAVLSRYCVVPYCMIVHSAALRPLGMTAREVLALLDSPPLAVQEADLPLGVLPVPLPAVAAAPTPDSPLEKTLLYCATSVFLEQPTAEACQAELRRLLGPDLYPHLIAYLAYVHTCHTWVEAHPDISYEADQRAREHLGALLDEEPALAEFFRHYQDRVAGIREARETEAAVAAERMRSERAIRESEEKLRLLVDGAKDYAMILMDTAGCVTGWNAGAERILGWGEAETLGRAIGFIFTPEDVEAGIASQELFKAASEGKAMDVRWHLRRDGSRFWADGIMEGLRDEAGGLRGFAKILRDATADKSADEQSRQAQEDLREAYQHTAGILESITDAFYALDRQWRFTYLNAQAERLLFRPRAELLGKNLWEEFPGSEGADFYGRVHQAAAQQTAITFEEYYAPLAAWFDVRVYPSPDGLSVYFHDISERKRSETDLRLLSGGLASAVDGIIIADARLADFPVVYANTAFLSLTGYSEEEVIGRNCRFLQGEDTDPAAVRQIREALRAGELCRVPLLNYRKDHTPFWNDLVISPMRDAAGVLTHFVGVQHDATALRQTEVALRESERRFRRMADTVPNIVWTARPDGSLDYYNQRWHDYTGLTLEETRDWGWEKVIHEEGRAQMVAVYRTAIQGATAYEDEFQLQRADGEHRWHLARGLPIKDEAGNVVQWVGTCTDITAQKNEAQMQAVLFDREHAIAAQLQAALQPELPGTVPGLAVTRYYEPALEASEGVGGDFYDCYVLDAATECVALVVGDLSGKGLAAAVQVAVVRHGLRTALHLTDTLVEAVTRLNEMLVEQQSLAAFATLFVGAFDRGSRELRYVNCGQEPALVRRCGTGVVEELASTGPILGCLSGVVFQEARVRLGPGDALAIFTDGLTECGPSRAAMLGVEGVAALFGSPTPQEDAADAAEMAERLALRLISGVDTAAAGGVMRDDVCLLVAVVDGS